MKLWSADDSFVSEIEWRRPYEEELASLLDQNHKLFIYLANIKKDVSTQTEKFLKRTTKLQLWIKVHEARVFAKPTRSGGRVETLKIQVLERLSMLENVLLEVIEEAGAEVAVDVLHSKYQGDRSWFLAMTLDQNEQFDQLVQILKEKKVQDLPVLDDLQSILRTIISQEHLMTEVLNFMNDLKTHQRQVLKELEIVDKRIVATSMVLLKSRALHQLSVMFSVLYIPSLFFYLILMFALTGWANK